MTLIDRLSKLNGPDREVDADDVCVICGNDLEDGDAVYWSSHDDGHMHAECATSYIDDDGNEVSEAPEPIVFKSDKRVMSVGETISKRMKDLRKQHKLSLQQVADRAGTSKSHIWEMENGRSKNPTVDMAVSIANALGVSLDYLTGLSTQTPDLHPEALRIACEIDALLRAKEASK
ncbi:hypothetical protein DEA98_14045 [Brucella pseudogrignonensis]|uniref:XRE family transcriptional regulator n=1 Tax=Brucella pseudogrignonensis TaxID=419475 RepID=A0A7Y3T7D9_9HYPH|nr:helix-turn-helix transcriptional regulator [Brucella pseudogrignonensis]MCM0751990.1 hypothetical protein [Brucella pseudogrignonensis]NNV20582.1 XRE family transcriptional regulator [Brucella pseudogrignonensis]